MVETPHPLSAPPGAIRTGTWYPTGNKTHTRRTHHHPAPSSSQAVPQAAPTATHTEQPQVSILQLHISWEILPPHPQPSPRPLWGSWEELEVQLLPGRCISRMKQRLFDPKERRAHFGQLEPGLAAASRGQDPNIYTQTDFTYSHIDTVNSSFN